MGAPVGPGKNAVRTSHDGWTYAMWKPGEGSPVLFAVAPEDGEWGQAQELFPATAGYELAPAGWHTQEDYIFALVDCRSTSTSFSPIVRQVWPDGSLGPCFADGDKPCHDLPFLVLMPCDEPCSDPCDAGCAGLVSSH